MDDNLTTWLYFFSSVFQGNAALLSVLAVYVVLRLQSIATLILSLEAHIEVYFHSYFHDRDKFVQTINYAAVEDLPEVVREIEEGRRNVGGLSGPSLVRGLKDDPLWKRLWSERSALTNIRSNLVAELILPAMLLGSLIICSLLLIPMYYRFSSFIHPIYVLTVLFQVTGLVFMFRYVYRALTTRRPQV